MCVAITVEWLTFDVFHEEVGKAVVGCAPVQQPGDMGMIQCGQYLAFLAEATQDKIGIHAALDQFDCRPLVELIVGAYGFIDRAHSTASNLTHDPIGAQTTTNHRIFFLVIVTGQGLNGA